MLWQSISKIATFIYCLQCGHRFPNTSFYELDTFQHGFIATFLRCSDVQSKEKCTNYATGTRSNQAILLNCYISWRKCDIPLTCGWKPTRALQWRPGQTKLSLAIQLLHAPQHVIIDHLPMTTCSSMRLTSETLSKLVSPRNGQFIFIYLSSESVAIDKDGIHSIG